jgi:hypothetical protein
MLHQDISGRDSLKIAGNTDTAHAQRLTIAVFAVSPEHEPTMLVISVADRDGCPVGGLSAQDFQVTTADGRPVEAKNFGEDAALRGSYRMRVVADRADSLRVDVARAQTGLRGRGIVNFNSKRSL